MNHFKLLLKQFFNNSFLLVWAPIVSSLTLIREDEPTFWHYFFTIFSTIVAIILVVVDIIAFRKTLKKLKED